MRLNIFHDYYPSKDLRLMEGPKTGRVSAKKNPEDGLIYLSNTIDF